MINVEPENIEIKLPLNHNLNSGGKLYFNQLCKANYHPEKIHSVVISFLNNFQLRRNDFPLTKGSYSRTLLFRGQNRLELMIARWDQGTKTPIHGHPDFIYEYLLEGLFQIESFKKKGYAVTKIANNIQQSGDVFSFRGLNGRFDNAIHRITALKESLSLHIYSDDASKGEIFSRFETI